MRVKEDSLNKALEVAGLQVRGLPHQYKDGKDPFWIRAVVLVQKRSMEECYCIYQQNADRYMSLLQDLGTPSPIMSVKSIHPYIYLDETRFLPSGNLESKKSFLKRELGEDPRANEVDYMTDYEVNKQLIAFGIKRQLECLEEDRKANILNEGSDVDGTNFEEIEKQKLETEIAFMRKDGCSKAEIKAFREEWEKEHKHSDNEADDADFLSDEDRLRLEMESKDLGEQEKKESEVSVDGEFDEVEPDYSKIEADTEEHRLELIRQAKRKWKREHDGNSDIRDGFACENEFGEKEEIETLQMPPKVEMPKEKRKPGRPKKQVRAGITKRKNNAAKRAAANKE